MLQDYLSPFSITSILDPRTEYASEANNALLKAHLMPTRCLLHSLLEFTLQPFPLETEEKLKRKINNSITMRLQSLVANQTQPAWVFLTNPIRYLGHNSHPL